MYLLYSIIYGIVLSFLIIPEFLKRSLELRRVWIKEKLGNIPVSGEVIWVHAVSVGEVSATIPMLSKLKELYPDIPIVLSTITDTGRKVALEKSPEGTYVVYLPFDLKFALKRCLRIVMPKIFIAVETELWPNLFRVFSGAGVPVVVLNGRISEKSSRGYRRISFMMKKVLGHVRIFGMQSESDAERIAAIGAQKEKIAVIGNFKFETSMSKTLPEWTRKIKGPVIVAGSTHKGEEEILLSAFMENLKTFPGLTLVIAPRHPARFTEAEDVIKKSGLPYQRRSNFDNPTIDSAIANYRILLLDTVGELSSVYGIADIAIIGKSFMGFGGQNPLEPAFWGKAIICGPHMENFPFMADFYRKEAAFEVDEKSLAKKIKELLLNPEKALASGQKAKALFSENSGAVERAIKIINENMR